MSIVTLSQAERDLAKIVFVLRQVCERLQIPFVQNANTSPVVPSPQTGTVAQFVGADSAAANVLLDAFGAGPVYATRRADGTCAAPVAIAGADETLGALSAYGYGSTGYGGARVSVQLRSAEAFTDTAQGTYIRFVTCAIGEVSEVESARIFHLGGNYSVLTFARDLSGVNYAVAGSPLDVNTYINALSGGAVTFRVANVTVGYAGTTGMGYAAGQGGTVTQATSKSTGVTLNKVCGQITLNNAALAADAIVSFVLTNSAIAAGDVLVLNHVSGGTPGKYVLNARAGSGSATIDVTNISTGSLSEAIVIAFAVIKAATS